MAVDGKYALKFKSVYSVKSLYNSYSIEFPVIEVSSGGLLDDLISVRSSTVFGAFLAGLIIAFMAAAVPAYQSLRLKVVDALREA